jgi:hypothetical protein
MKKNSKSAKLQIKNLAKNLKEESLLQTSIKVKIEEKDVLIKVVKKKGRPAKIKK